MVNPTGYTALDLIGYTDRGNYSPSANYVKNDLVHYSGNIWRVLIDDTTNVTPSEGANYTLFIGEPSNLVEKAIAPIETTPSTAAYTVGRRLFFNDVLYEVIAPIAIGDTLVTYESDPSNANIKVSAKVEEQIDDINAVLADLGTAAKKNSTNAVTSGSTDLVESGAVHSAIQTVSNKVSNSGDAYSPSKAYKVGEYVIHDDVLYKCTTACSAAAWSVNQSCFTTDTLANAVTIINTHLPVHKMLPPVACVQGWNLVDVTSMDSTITRTNYKNILVSLYDTNNSGGLAIASAFSTQNYWRIYFYSDRIQYWTPMLECIPN